MIDMNHMKWIPPTNWRIVGCLVLLTLSFLSVVPFLPSNSHKNTRNLEKPVVALVTAAYGRPIVTEFVFRYYRYTKRLLRDQIDLRLFAAVSEESMLELCQLTEWECVLVENLPLGKKWNAVLQLVKERIGNNLYCVITTGSDDVLSHGVFNFAAMKSREGNDWRAFGLREVYFVDVEKHRAVQFGGYAKQHIKSRVSRKNEPVGCGRMISPQTLEELNWLLWDGKANKSLDFSMWKRLEMVYGPFKVDFMEQSQKVVGSTVALDLKTREGNMWGYGVVLSSGDLVESEELDKILASIGVPDMSACLEKLGNAIVKNDPRILCEWK